MSGKANDLPTGTMQRRREQYRDRWSSFDAQTGLLALSDQLSAEELRQYPLFADYDETFLDKIAPDVSVAVWRPGSVLFEQGSYIDLAFFVVEGEIEVCVEGVDGQAQSIQPIFDLSRTVMGAAASAGTAQAPEGTMLMRQASRDSATKITFLATMDFDLPMGVAARLGPGEVLGEIGTLSGWPQSVTARAASECTLIQVRLPALRRMKRKSSAFKERLDAVYKERSLAAQLKNTPLFARCSDLFIEALKEQVELVSCEPGETIMRAGDEADAFYVLRSGFVKLQQSFGDGEITVSYLSKGMSLGEVELLNEEISSWQSTAESVEFAELVKIPLQAFQQLLSLYPDVEEELWRKAVDRVRETGFARRHVGHSEFLTVALDSGLVQGNSILAIDLNLCTRCDDCVRACAATHEGRPRFIREGDKYRNLMIAKSCYHCRDPVCLVGCPTGAIHRAGVGEMVEISEDICIGCSSCARNCPYDSIVMHDCGEAWPDDMVPQGLRGRPRQVASKCDGCHDTGHGPACVSNCPQGCAFRVGSLEEFQQLLEEGE